VPRGSLADIRLKSESLNERSRRSIAARLKSRTRAAYDQIRTDEAYATLTTCRREHLLRHFGDNQEVAPCSGCDVCLGEADGATALLLARSVGCYRRGSTKHTRRRTCCCPEEWSDGATGASPEADIDEELFERLRAWRGDQARSQQVPAYVVLHNSHLEEIARRKPQSVHELGSIKGVGLRRAARYGDELLALVAGRNRCLPPRATVSITVSTSRPPSAFSVPEAAPLPSPSWPAPWRSGVKRPEEPWMPC
jgi:ATP-dependent DNA helicase RecQ